MPEPIYSLEQFLGAPQSASVTLTSAQLLDLHNTPVTLVAAPGAGKWLDVHRVSLAMKYGTAAYVGASNGLLRYGTEDKLVWDYIDPLLYITTDSTGTYVVAYIPYMDGYDMADLENKALMLDNSANGALTAGDGTATVTVTYSVEDVPS